MDFDRTILRIAYEVGVPELRSRIAEKARKAGRVEWEEIATGGRKRRRLEEMTDAEWETTLVVLRRHRQWEAMWSLAQVAPAVWSLRCLRWLKTMPWAPKAEEECTAFSEVVRLAEGCGEKVPEQRGLGGDGTLQLWTSRLADVCHLPLRQTNFGDMVWVQETLQREALSDAERRWLEFLLGMMRWRRRFDIGVGEAPWRVTVGEFDIEIEG
jgi:hypothetical protein